jgi:hypothetical protein
MYEDGPKILGALYCDASPPGAPPPRFHGVSIIAELPLGAACRIASTPLSTVIAVWGLVAVPSVARMMTASPFCRFISAKLVDGIRLNIR